MKTSGALVAHLHCNSQKNNKVKHWTRLSHLCNTHSLQALKKLGKFSQYFLVGVFNPFWIEMHYVVANYSHFIELTTKYRPING